MAETVLIAGSMAQKPGYGGHTWVFLQYLLGFRQMGWNVIFLDQLEPETCKDINGQPCPVEESVQLSYFQMVMERFGLGNSYAVIYNKGERFLGLSRVQVKEHAKNAAFLLNVMGFLSDKEILECVPQRVFLDIDPGFGQMWRDLGLHDPFAGHDQFVTIGENIGRPGCQIPDCGLNWITTPQPVVLELWPSLPEPSHGAFSTIASWRGTYGPLEFRGKIYGLRVHEFRPFAPLPHQSGAQFDLALDIHPDETADLELLRRNGWNLVDPKVAAGDPWTYQEFIRQSRGEFMVAKSMYVQTNSGWFSDRSICYLASGRPVLAQDTGITSLYPVGEGLLTFTNLEEAVSGYETIRSDWKLHACAARAVAEEFFESNKILGRLLDKLGVS